MITISSRFTWSGSREGEHHAVGDLVRGHRLDTFVDRIGGTLVAAEPDDGELRLDEARVDRRDPDRPAQEVLPEGVREAADGEFRGDVRRPVRVGLPPGDRAHEHDVALVAEVGQCESSDAEDAVDIRVQDTLLVVGRRVGERCPSERQTRVVEEDVHSTEPGYRLLDERRRARLNGDVEWKRQIGVDPPCPPGPAGDAHTGLAQLAHGGGADPGRGTRDDRALAGQIHPRSLSRPGTPDGGDQRRGAVAAREG